MYKITIELQTDEREAPNIFAAKTGRTYLPGTTWLTDTVYKEGPGKTWVKTPAGFWTAAEYPVNNDPTNIKVYATYALVPDPVGHYDPSDRFLHEVDGVIVAEYHRWIT